MKFLIDAWLRRWWRADPEAMAGLSGERPALVVTGGSEGIGLALARAFAAPDRTVVLVARRPDVLDAAADRLRGEGRARDVVTVPLDVTDPVAPARLAAALAERNLYADMLINDAGIGASGDYEKADPAVLRQLTMLNVTALDALMRAFLPAMLIRGRGGVINVASLGGLVPGPYQATYYASKAFVISLTRAVAYEARGKGVRIATVAPGPVNTAFHARMDAEQAIYRLLLPALSPDQVARSTRRGYHLGHTLIIPGVFNSLLALALWVLPVMLTVPMVAILLKPRSFGDHAGQQKPRS